MLIYYAKRKMTHVNWLPGTIVNYSLVGLYKNLKHRMQWLTKQTSILESKYTVTNTQVKYDFEFLSFILKMNLWTCVQPIHQVRSEKSVFAEQDLQKKKKKHIRMRLRETVGIVDSNVYVRESEKSMLRRTSFPDFPSLKLWWILNCIY